MSRVTIAVTKASLVPLVVQAGKEEAVEQFLNGGLEIINKEPATIQVYAAKVLDSSPSEYIIFDTFVNEEGRTAHLTGELPKALMQQGPSMLIGGLKVNELACEILVERVLKTVDDSKAGLKTGLRVLFTAKPGKREAVRQFLGGATQLLEGEPDTLVWYAVHWPGTDKFAVVDFFADDAGREAHLSGKIAAALIGSVEENLTGMPDITVLEVLAAKV